MNKDDVSITADPMVLRCPECGNDEDFKEVALIEETSLIDRYGQHEKTLEYRPQQSFRVCLTCGNSKPEWVPET